MIRVAVGKHITYKQLYKGKENNEVISDFFERKGFITINGRKAISLVCKKLNLKYDDEIYITTTFGTHYVSSCVTCTIFNFCKPSKILSNKTKAIFVIHEFGVPHNKIFKLKKLAQRMNIPLIEDCAHSIDSYINDKRIGQIGDYTIFSLPKVLEIPYGGIVLGDIEKSEYKKTRMEEESLAFIEFSLEKYLYRAKTYSRKRRNNFRFLCKKIKELNLKLYFEPNDNISPYAFPFIAKKKEEIINLFRENYIECFSWLADEIVVLPVHQCLNQIDLKKFVNLLKMLDNHKLKSI